MSDYVNLDELTTDDEDAEEPDGSDWLSPENTAPTDDREGGNGVEGTAGSDGATAPTAGDGDEGTTDPADTRLPHVPHPNKDKPVGIPTGGGGAGGAATGQGSNTTAGTEDAATAEPAEGNGGPHGRDADEMTLAMTYEAAKALANPSAAFADANRWADWIGIVGDVPAHTLNKFQRDHHIDLDFFNGAGMEPAERLADIDERSMFYAERLVLVGREDQRALAERAGWEFVPLSEAAGKADWDHGDP